MELWLWILIGYATIVMINVLWAFIKSSKSGFFISILIILSAFILGLIVTPFLWLVALGRLYLYDTPKYKIYTIHALTEDNKTTLRQLGFQEGHFISNNNMDYDGFRWNKGDIYVLYNGRIGVKYRYMTSFDQDHLFKQIKELPKGDESKKEEEVIIKPKRTYTKRETKTENTKEKEK